MVNANSFIYKNLTSASLYTFQVVAVYPSAEFNSSAVSIETGRLWVFWCFVFLLCHLECMNWINEQITSIVDHRYKLTLISKLNHFTYWNKFLFCHAYCVYTQLQFVILCVHSVVNV